MRASDTDGVTIEVTTPILDKWRKAARQSSKEHAAASKLFSSASEIMSAVTIALSTCSGIVSIVVAAMGGGLQVHGAETSEVLTGVVSIAAGGLLAVSKSLGITRRAEQHREFSNRYSELARDITTEAALQAIDGARYKSDAELIKAIQCELDRLDEMSPTVPKSCQEAVRRLPSSEGGAEYGGPAAA